ncbi:UNVERIFIED_CONTAM: hypothetical protein RMT77_018389 [Armadillidium vulgare]
MLIEIILIICNLHILLLFIFLITFRIYNRYSLVFCKSSEQIQNKTVIITGASSGIGKECAKNLSKRGGRIILACRNIEKAQNVADEIIRESGNSNVFVRKLDLTSLSSVRCFAKEILHNEKRLDILVLNAGISGTKEKKTTENGLESTMAANYCGHFLLVNLLAGFLKSSNPSRVIITTSTAMLAISKINPKDLNFEKEKYTNFRAYAVSTLCSALMTKYLAVYFLNKGITVNCVAPGIVKTELYEKSPNPWVSKVMKAIVYFTGRSEEEGAQTHIYLAVSEDVRDVTGAFFMDCKERKGNRLMEDAGIIKKVWEASEELVQLTPQERSSRINPTI